MRMLPRGGKALRAKGANMTSSPSSTDRSKAAKPGKPAAAKSFTITELAAEFDVTPRAIRFYEDVGLLEPTRAGRNRVYSQRERTRLKLTLRGKRLGLSLQEIKQLVDMYDSPSDTAPQLEDIRVTLEEIAQHEARCERLLEAAGAPVATGKRAARA